MSVASSVDMDREVVTGRVEHLTIYLPVARQMVLGNHAPTISVLGALPDVRRSGLGFHVRAQVRDHEVGGALARVRVYDRNNGGNCNDRDKDANNVALAVDGETAYVAFTKTDGNNHDRLYVSHFDGTSWVANGGGLGINQGSDASSPTIAVTNGKVYVGWVEYDGQVRKARVKVLE